MKKIILSITIALGAILFLAFHATQDFLQTLKISGEDADNYISDSFHYGSFAYPYSEVYHSLASSAKIAMVKEIGTFAKTYTKTDAFKKKYEDFKLSKKPTEPDPYQTNDQLKTQYKDQMQKSIDDLEEQMKNATGDTKTMIQNALNTIKEQMKQFDDPDNPMFSAEMENARKNEYQGQVQEYQKELADWNDQYPDTPEKMIKQRLNYFLQLSGTVDFNAKLTKNQYGTLIFDNPDYENKPDDWKLVFRAGKVSTDAARQIAQQWLAELQ